MPHSETAPGASRTEQRTDATAAGAPARASAGAAPSTRPAAADAAAGADAAPTSPSARPKRTNAATDLALIATFAAFIAVCAILPAITIAGPVPFTLQTFAILLTGAVLGARRGFLAAALYLAIGAIGLPVFAGGAAGLAPFAGPTVGYLLSFPLAAAATGAIVSRIPRRGVALGALLIFLAALVGVVVNHGLGILGLVWRADMTFGQAALADLVFLPGDVVKALLAAVIAAAVHRAFPALLPRRSRG